jgi:peptidoglycan/LPS O-acetylase OafA/YrhL
MDRGKRLDIQALRAIAVLSVVVYHFWPGSLIGGFMGVDIFFVISGYLMTSTLMRDAQPVIAAKKEFRATGTYLVNFYARRIKRLIPAASVTLLATFGLVLLSGNLSLIQETTKQIAASALFIQNWFLANSSVDYLANTNPTAVQHFWSLSLEEQFYAAWPLLLVIILIVTSSLFIVYKKKQLVSLAILPVILLIAGFFAYGFYLTQTQPSLAYFVTPARVWELLIGGAIAFLPLLKNYDLRLLLPWIGFAMISYSLYSWGGDNFPGWHALFPTIGTVLIIYAGGMAGDSKWSFEHLLRFKPIQWLGNLSYSLYLWHWPLIILLPVLFFIDLDAHPQSILIKLGILALALIMAQLSYRYVEQSTQHLKLKKRYVYASFILITALIAGLGYFVSNHTEATTKSAVKEIRAIAVDDSDPCTGAKSVFNNCDKSFGYIHDKYSQIASNDKYDDLLNYGKTCSSYDAKRYNSQIGDFCVVGDLNAKREVTIWGDSHAQHWINPMDKIGIENNIKVNIIGTSSCFGSTQYQKNCDVRFDRIRDTGVLDNSESIIVSMWHSEYFNNKGNNIVNALSTLQSMTDNKNVYLLEDVPISGKEGGPDCNALRQSCKNTIKDATGPITKDSRDIIEMKLLAAERVISIKDIFCDSNYCYSNIGGIQTYRDKAIGTNKNALNSHMTASFAYSIWPALEQKLKDAGAIK